MLFTDVIRAKRDGGELSGEQIQYFVDGLADESIPAEQVASLAMAVFLNGMTFAEAATLTIGMSRSGAVLDWSDAALDGPVVDKHSTGGVGDKVSFLLAPIAAACGCYVPMISGRGLGHTGGTTDKAEAIPGYDTAPDFETFKHIVKSVRDSRRHGHGRVDTADHRVDPVQENCGWPRRAGNGRQGRQRCIHAKLREVRRPREKHHRNGCQCRAENQRRAHRHEPGARHDGR
jgi:thymidine phosphorylase